MGWGHHRYSPDPFLSLLTWGQLPPYSLGRREKDIRLMEGKTADLLHQTRKAFITHWILRTLKGVLSSSTMALTRLING